jgi:hypothetical protein
VSHTPTCNLDGHTDGQHHAGRRPIAKRRAAPFRRPNSRHACAQVGVRGRTTGRALLRGVRLLAGDVGGELLGRGTAAWT